MSWTGTHIVPIVKESSLAKILPGDFVTVTFTTNRGADAVYKACVIAPPPHLLSHIGIVTVPLVFET
jgi:hypothetical protein